MKLKTEYKRVIEYQTLESDLIKESLENKRRLENVRMRTNWVDNCCWC